MRPPATIHMSQWEGHHQHLQHSSNTASTPRNRALGNFDVLVKGSSILQPHALSIGTANVNSQKKLLAITPYPVERKASSSRSDEPEAIIADLQPPPLPADTGRFVLKVGSESLNSHLCSRIMNLSTRIGRIGRNPVITKHMKAIWGLSRPPCLVL